MTVEEREEALSMGIDEALEDARDSRATVWDAAYVDVQRDRLHILLRPWLELEMERSRRLR